MRALVRCEPPTVVWRRGRRLRWSHGGRPALAAWIATRGPDESPAAGVVSACSLQQHHHSALLQRRLHHHHQCHSCSRAAQRTVVQPTSLAMVFGVGHDLSAGCFHAVHEAVQWLAAAWTAVIWSGFVEPCRHPCPSLPSTRPGFVRHGLRASSPGPCAANAAWVAPYALVAACLWDDAKRRWRAPLGQLGTARRLVVVHSSLLVACSPQWPQLQSTHTPHFRRQRCICLLSPSQPHHERLAAFT